MISAPTTRSVRRLFSCLVLSMVSACSAANDPSPTPIASPAQPGSSDGPSSNPSNSTPSNNDPNVNPPNDAPTDDDPGPLDPVVEDEPSDLILDEPAPSGGVAPTPNAPVARDLGGEELCDGLDENDNGIIDDVDVGKDGLCDCIRLGFFGQISSDAGSETAAFQAWLEERSGEVPVKNLAATGTLTAEWLADIQVLVVGGMQERAARGAAPYFTPAELAAFDDWLTNQGNGVFTLGGYTADSIDIAPTNELLGRSGVQYQTAGIASEGVIGEGAPPVWLDGIVAPDHPSVEGVSEIGFFYGYPVTGEGTVILQETGYDLAIAKELGTGRAFIFSDEWITQDVTWSGTQEGANDPCQQPCNEQDNICRIATEQCTNCEMQPCSDPSDPDPETCTKGCQPSCENETNRCLTYTEQCEACTADVTAREQATPRLWLNTIRWLTPANECKVEIPVIIRAR